MEKIIYLLFIFVNLFFVGAWARAEKIDSFDVNIQINSDASINVIESVKMNFEGAERHGIYRDIPLIYKDQDGKKYQLPIENTNVTDEKARPYLWEESWKDNNYDFKIGDPEKIVTSTKEYIIYYTIRGAINYFSDHDELYWNTTGNTWPFPILKSTVVVSAPVALESGKIKYKCFVGGMGSKEECPGSVVNQIKGKEQVVGFRNNKKLEPGEGMTIVFSLPKGILPVTNDRQIIIEDPAWLKPVKLFWPLGITLIVFVVMFLLWRYFGRDPRGKGTIIPQYDIPDNLSPSEVGTIIDEDADNKDISAELIYLAIKGYLKISKEEGDYKFIKLKAADQSLNKFQATLLEKIFSSGVEKKLSELKNSFYKDLKIITTEVYESTVVKGYFAKSPEKIRSKYLVAAFVFGVIGFYFSVFDNPFFTIAIIVSGFIIGGFGWVMPARTKKGVEAREYILGLKKYLEVAESERIKFHNAPEKNPATFEKFLPAAMVLGVEKQWAGQFADIYNQPPDWYYDPSMSHFSSLNLAQGLTNFNKEAYTTLSSQPASSGGSGFSGGSSGGGFGGGGGGSW